MMGRQRETFLFVLIALLILSLTFFSANSLFSKNGLINDAADFFLSSSESGTALTTSWKCATDSAKARIAFIITNANVLAEAFDFVETAKFFLLGTNHRPIASNITAQRCNFVRVKFFILTSNVAAERQRISKDVLLLKTNGSELNPCSSAWKHAQRLRLFQGTHYDFILMADARTKLLGPIDVAQTFLTKRLAVLHQTYPNLKYLKTFNRTHPEQLSTLHYSSRFFGGSTHFVAAMCDRLAKRSDFHEALNDLLIRNKPRHLLLPKRNHREEKLKVSDQSMYPSRVFHFEGKLVLPPVEQNEFELAKAYEIDDELRQSNHYQKAAQKVSETMQKMYIQSKIHNLFHKKNDSTLIAPFMTAFCQPNVTCGGFGDRLRGIVQAFYLAMATDRIFHVAIDRPNALESYFELNAELYGVSPQKYEKQRSLATTKGNVERLNQMGAMSWFVDYLKSSDFQEHVMPRKTNIELTSNRYVALEALFKTKRFSEKIEALTKFKLNSEELGQFDFPIHISAAYRLLFSRPTARLLAVLDNVITTTVGWATWRSSIRIGVQLRTENLAGFALDKTDRIRPDQIVCFGMEVRDLIEEKIRKSRHAFTAAKKQSILVFITSDWHEAHKLLQQKLSNVENVTLMWTSKEQHNLTITHVDQSDNPDWMLHAKNYVDWYLLTQMDFLVISRSGYGETASMASLKPTKRFAHWETYSACPFQTYNAFFPSVLQFGNRGVHSL